MNGPRVGLGGRGCPRTVELLISCRNLADLDVFTKTDPMCVLFVKQFGQWKEYGRTEASRDTLNPRFVESFLMEYDPTVQQQLMFSVYDIDSRSNDLRHHDFVGSVEVKLEDLVDDSRPLLTSTRTLRVPGDPKARGTLYVTSEFVRDTRGKVQVHAAGHKLEKIGMFRRKVRARAELTAHARFVTDTSCTPLVWRPFDVSIQRMCNDDWDRQIQFSCWHENSTAGPGTRYEMVGKVTTTLREINNMKHDGHYRKLHLVCPKKEKSKKKDTSAGSLRLYQFRIDMQYSLLDYIRGGLQLRLVIAIDFTASNGATTESLSLHNLNTGQTNQYVTAIELLGGVLSRYDMEQRVAVFGFGAKQPGDPTPSHCFPLHSDTWVRGVTGVLEAYNSVLPSLTFAGPTYIAPVLQQAIELTQNEATSRDSHVYYVLLVITDGVINDVDRTVEELVGASSLPLSVLIMGVGPTDFSLMEQFHVSLHGPLFDGSSKKTALRPNAHFAHFKKDAISSGGHVLVVQEALAALSSQVLQYMKMRDVTPGRPRVSRADPARSWVDPNAKLDSDEEAALTSSFPVPLTSSMRKSKSLTSVRHAASTSSLSVAARRSMFSLNGPVCPTCGSTVDYDVTGDLKEEPRHTFRPVSVRDKGRQPAAS
ncbi:hypothetical protein BaRGS_00025490 [Batillaria attramentaria]|uniref:Copine n=1 Tax=Batillaria attramentaria TaxID=370345 RepID=A0ABD0K8C7_9CAEN